MSIELNGSSISPTISEIYLGIYISSDMSWQQYIYGEKWRNKDNYPGLIPIVNSRLGMLNKLSKFASREKMKIMVDGIVLSKLRYNLGIIGKIWIKSPYRDNEVRYRTFTKKDNQRLQVTMNKALKMALGKKIKNYPTADLLRESGKLSIHQETAYQVGIQVKKIMKIQKPASLSIKFKQRDTRNTRNQRYVTRDTRLVITQESFVNQGINLLNQIPPEILAIEKNERFKREYRKWVLTKIPIKP